jgi:RNA polymerase sigma-70 factor (ECF subfamily)
MRPGPILATPDQVAEAARSSYGRIVAWLARQFGSLADAEDALSDALEAALVRWPQDGLPRSPEAWLLTTARRRLLDRLRRATTISQSAALISQLSEETVAETADALHDSRLTLMFVCTHPAINPAIRAPLMLQTVLGLPARRIASAFLVPPGTMAVNLARAKAKIAAACVPFTDPEPQDLPDRIGDVLDAVYAAYTLGQDRPSGDAAFPEDLATEALWLSSLICRLAPASDEAHGLFALVLFGLARRPARLDADGRYVPLDQQDPRLWDSKLLADAELALRNARRSGRIGRFHLEAAIEALHVEGIRQGRTDWVRVLQLYQGLETMVPTLGVACGRIAALAEIKGAAAGLAALDDMNDPRMASYQPAWALRGHLLRRLGRQPESSAAYLSAAALTEDPSLQSWLRGQARGPSPNQAGLAAGLRSLSEPS